MKPTARRHAIPVLLGLFAAGPAFAEHEDERYGRIRHVEPGVAVQRATEGGAEEALPNMPFLPGDRVWTDGSGRAEFQFEGGGVLRLDRRSKLDYVEGRDRIVLRLWSGSAFVRTRDRYAPDFELETPAGLVETRERGLYRIDVEPGEVRLSVYEGEAALSAEGRRVEVEEGERSWAVRGDIPENPRRFDRRDSDDFAYWSEERDDRLAWAGNQPSYLPEEVYPYTDELEANGSWYYEAEVGHVWRPYVAAGWRPYVNGRWVWTVYGWTWVPHEPWGWAPFHYGRWGYSTALSWYWIPGRVWGPAWVSWAVGGDYVGWCPLGYRDRPVVVDTRHPRDLGHAVPRGSVTTAAPATAWVYARRNEVASRDLARHRVELSGDAAAGLRTVDAPRARPSRDFRMLDAAEPPGRERAVPRTPLPVKTKPTIGDTVPELRSDNKTTIPAPVARRPRPHDDVRYETGERRVERGASGEEPRAHERREADPLTSEIEREVERRPAPSRRDEARPADSRYAPRDEGRGEPRDSGAVAVPRTREREDTSRGAEPEREVLRRIFRPLTEPSSRGGDTRTATPRSEPRPSQPPPRVESPRHSSPPPSDRGHAAQRKEKDNN